MWQDCQPALRAACQAAPQQGTGRRTGGNCAL